MIALVANYGAPTNYGDFTHDGMDIRVVKDRRVPVLAVDAGSIIHCEWVNDVVGYEVYLILGYDSSGELLLLSPWSRPPLHFWPIKLYLLLSTTLIYGLVGWFIYASLTDSRLFTKLLSHSLDIDVFDLTPHQVQD